MVLEWKRKGRVRNDRESKRGGLKRERKGMENGEVEESRDIGREKEESGI